MNLQVAKVYRGLNNSNRVLGAHYTTNMEPKNNIANYLGPYIIQKRCPPPSPTFSEGCGFGSSDRGVVRASLNPGGVV